MSTRIFLIFLIALAITQKTYADIQPLKLGEPILVKIDGFLFINKDNFYEIKKKILILF